MKEPRDEEGIMRLKKSSRKGLLNMAFTRLPLILLLLAVQVLLLAVMYRAFSRYVPYFATFMSVFTIAMVLYIINCSMDPTAKLTWVLLIAIFPVGASIFFAFTQTNLGHRSVKNRTEHILAETRGALGQSEEVLQELAAPENADSGLQELYRYANRSGCMPVFEGTQVTYFPSGEDKLAALIPELEKAEKFIFLEYFIIDEGEMWGRVLDVLARKAARGVDVRVMYDGMFVYYNLPHDYPKRLERLGIKTRVFSPIMALVSTHYNYRDHRKILVVDNKVAFTGGINLADEYINRVQRFGHWKDTAVMLRGEAVRSFTLMFLQMWSVMDPRPDFSPVHAPGVSVSAPGYVMPYADSPLDGDRLGESVYIDILYRAKKYVHIMTPYLILDGELETALKYASQRGVDVKIILPGIPDKKLAFSLAKTHYPELLDAGVKLYEYTPGFVHAKNFTSDDVKGVVGSINLDYRSLYHHFECAAYMYKTPCIADMEADFAATLEKCREVTPETIRNEKMFYKVMGRIMKLVAPMM